MIAALIVGGVLGAGFLWIFGMMARLAWSFRQLARRAEERGDGDLAIKAKMGLHLALVGMAAVLLFAAGPIVSLIQRTLPAPPLHAEVPP